MGGSDAGLGEQKPGHESGWMNRYWHVLLRASILHPGLECASARCLNFGYCRIGVSFIVGVLFPGADLSRSYLKSNKDPKLARFLSPLPSSTVARTNARIRKIEGRKFRQFSCTRLPSLSREPNFKRCGANIINSGSWPRTISGGLPPLLSLIQGPPVFHCFMGRDG